MAKKKLADTLAEVARIGALFMDGDAAEAVHADETSATWTGADDVNFAHEPYINVKRTVLLVERMQDVPCRALFALRRTDAPSKLEAVVCGMENPHGRAPFPMNKPQRECIKKGVVTTELDSAAGAVSAYAPVRNSDNEVVGLLHVFA
ncbi:MAG: hypothetical protein R6V58_13025 [Planctomycetota bacterium]